MSVTLPGPLGPALSAGVLAMSLSGVDGTANRLAFFAAATAAVFALLLMVGWVVLRLTRPRDIAPAPSASQDRT